jgi:hypothetical protein
MARKADEMRMADRRLRMDVLMGHVLERLQEEAAAAASAAHGNPHIAWSSRLIDIARWDCDDEENAE